MVDEKSVGDKALDRAHGINLSWTGRANDGTGTQVFVDEFARLRHDQVGLQCLGLTLGQIPKRHGGSCDGVCVGQGKCIASLVLPSLKMHDLRPANTDEDAQNFQAGYLLSKGVVKTSTNLLDKSKMKAGREGDRLQVVGNAGRGLLRVLAFVSAL